MANTTYSIQSTSQLPDIKEAIGSTEILEALSSNKCYIELSYEKDGIWKSFKARFDDITKALLGKLAQYATKSDIDDAIAAIDGKFVHLTGDETIHGSKTFADAITISKQGSAYKATLANDKIKCNTIECTALTSTTLNCDDGKNKITNSAITCPTLSCTNITCANTANLTAKHALWS